MPGIFKTVNPAASVGNNRRTRTSLSAQFLFKCGNSPVSTKTNQMSTLALFRRFQTIKTPIFTFSK